MLLVEEEQNCSEITKRLTKKKDCQLTELLFCCFLFTTIDTVGIQHGQRLIAEP